MGNIMKHKNVRTRIKTRPRIAMRVGHNNQMASLDQSKIADVFDGCVDDFKRVEDGLECRVYYPTAITTKAIKQLMNMKLGDIIMYTDDGRSITLRLLHNKDTTLADAALKRYEEKSKYISMNTNSETPQEVRAAVYNMCMNLPIDIKPDNDSKDNAGFATIQDVPGGLWEIPMFLPFDGQLSVHVIKELVKNSVKEAIVELREDPEKIKRLCVVCMVAVDAAPPPSSSSRKRPRSELASHSDVHPAGTRPRWSQP
jgi:hypothetical protein